MTTETKVVTHTPGPWQVGEQDKYAGGENPHRISSFQIYASSTYVAHIYQADNPDETVPNARLIAAAPDLLEAVRAGGRYSDALRRYQDNGVSGQVVPGTDELDALFMEWHDKGHAAIDKAEGR